MHPFTGLFFCVSIDLDGFDCSGISYGVLISSGIATGFYFYLSLWTAILLPVADIFLHW
jgi:hypothetical protein